MRSRDRQSKQAMLNHVAKRILDGKVVRGGWFDENGEVDAVASALSASAIRQYLKGKSAQFTSEYKEMEKALGKEFMSELNALSDVKPSRRAQRIRGLAKRYNLQPPNLMNV